MNQTQLKNLVFQIALCSVFWGCVIVLILTCCTGCNSTKFTKSANGDVSISNTRWFWTTDSYACNWTSNSASLDVNKSAPDTQALNNAIAAVINAAAK